MTLKARKQHDLKPLENIEDRLAMAAIHDDVLARIDSALDEGAYIDACWYAYSCFESRIERIMLKLMGGCPKLPRTDNSNPTGITTKIECIVRLCRNGHPFLSGASPDRFNTIKGWCRERNDLAHKLVTLEKYPNADADFRNLATRSKRLIIYAYEVASMVRNRYYTAETTIPIDLSIAGKCRCRERRCIFLPGEKT